MILVEIECDSPTCTECDAIDVYLDHWKRPTPINRFLPEDWTVDASSDLRGYPVVHCPECSAKTGR